MPRLLIADDSAASRRALRNLREGNGWEVFDSDDRPECHDKWKYDDRKCVATLVGFEIRCKACHFATHIGHAMKLGPMYLQIAAEQLRKVNGCTERDVQEMVAAAAMALWKKRNEKSWTVVVAPAVLKRYPRLREVPLMTPTPIRD